VPGNRASTVLRGPGRGNAPRLPDNTFADHAAVLTAAIRQIPSRLRSRLLVRVDGAGASHELITHLLSLVTSRRRVLFTCGWMITGADEQAIGRRQARNLTAFERTTGWRYSIIVTNIPVAGGIPGVPGSHHAQFIDVLHRQHAVVEDGVRAAKSMGLRNLPSETWQVNCGWVLAASLAADLAAWCRLLGLYDCGDLKDAEPDTLRYRLLSLPARLVRHARARVLKISRTWPWKEAFLACWQRLCALPAPA